VLLKPLPFRDPARLVRLDQAAPYKTVPEPEFVDYRRDTRSFEKLAAYNDATAVIGANGAGAEPERVQVLQVTDDFFATLGARVLLGRTFTAEEERHGGPDAVVLGRGLWTRRFGADPGVVGRSITVSGRSMTVVGVVPDVRHRGPEGATGPEVYVPSVPNPMMLVARTAGDPAAVASSVREAVRGLDPAAVVVTARTMDDALAAKLAERRFVVVLLAAFAAVAVTLAGLGIFGVMHYVVSQRTREIGIRVALGAEPRRVVGLVVAEGMRLALLGSVAGVIGALLLTRLMARMLYGVGATDLTTFAATSVLLLAVAAVASWVPARRATRIDPLHALRSD